MSYIACLQLLPELRLPVAEVFTAFLRCSDMRSSGVVDVISNATAAVITEMVNRIRQVNCKYCTSLSNYFILKAQSGVLIVK